ncbi:MAG TPA: hypothetical protein DDW53_10145 [Lachnoclostridium sp.]|nr:hypothetical protein [Lachnoclostridium sp.]
MAEGIEVFENTFRHQIQADGKIKVQDNFFKKKFGREEGEWPVEAGRYRLLWMPACPHVHGWVFTEDPDEKDPVLGIHYLKEIYDRDTPDGDYKERPTVPILADTTTGKGVNNDHFWIPVYFETFWKPYHKEGAPELYPAELRKLQEDSHE